MKKRGGQPRPKYNVRDIEGAATDLSEFPEGDPMRELMPDGQGLDYRLPPYPWDESTREFMTANLARLRVDPTHSNHTANETAIIRTIAKSEKEIEATNSWLGIYMSDLLADESAETAQQIFSDIISMKKWMEKKPHRHFLAYLAYCEFLKTFDLKPTRQRLAKFIKENPAKYPVGLSVPTTATEWWDMFLGAGLVRLEE
jgi:hypothetical protein